MKSSGTWSLRTGMRRQQRLFILAHRSGRIIALRYADSKRPAFRRALKISPCSNTRLNRRHSLQRPWCDPLPAAHRPWLPVQRLWLPCCGYRLRHRLTASPDQLLRWLCQKFVAHRTHYILLSFKQRSALQVATRSTRRGSPSLSADHPLCKQPTRSGFVPSSAFGEPVSLSHRVANVVG